MKIRDDIWRTGVSCILLLTGLQLHAQTVTPPPGYQGLRTIFRYDQGIFWDFFGDVVDPVPVLFYKANVEIVFSERHSFGIRYQYDNPRILAGDHFLKPIPDRKKVGELINHNAVFYTRFYRYRKAGHISPVGQYWVVGMSVNTYRYTGITDVQNLVQISGTTPTGADISLLAGTGKTFVVARRLILDVGLEFNIPVSAWRHNPLGGPIERSDAGVFTRQFNIFQVNLGIGFLAF